MEILEFAIFYVYKMYRINIYYNMRVFNESIYIDTNIGSTKTKSIMTHASNQENKHEMNVNSKKANYNNNKYIL